MFLPPDFRPFFGTSPRRYVAFARWTRLRRVRSLGSFRIRTSCGCFRLIVSFGTGRPSQEISQGFREGAARQLIQHELGFRSEQAPMGQSVRQARYGVTKKVGKAKLAKTCMSPDQSTSLFSSLYVEVAKSDMFLLFNQLKVEQFGL